MFDGAMRKLFTVECLRNGAPVGTALLETFEEDLDFVRAPARTQVSMSFLRESLLVILALPISEPLV